MNDVPHNNPVPDEPGPGETPIDPQTASVTQPGHGEGPSKPTGGAGNPDDQAVSPAIPTPTGPVQPPPDPFDPANLRLSQDFLSTGGVKRHITSLPARKPMADEWVRTHPDPAYTLDTLVLETKGSRECFLIAPSLRDELATESMVGPRRLHVAINRDGTVFVWPLKLPPADGRQDRWAESALAAAEVAKEDWVRVRADLKSGAYTFDTPIGELSQPLWPDMTFAQILKLAFRGNFIESRDHLVLRRLRGEV